jgi:hypothetical protein
MRVYDRYWIQQLGAAAYAHTFLPFLISLSSSKRSSDGIIAHHTASASSRPSLVFLLLTGDPVYTCPSVCDLSIGGRLAPLGRSKGLAWWFDEVKKPGCSILGVATLAGSSEDGGGGGGGASGSVRKRVRNCSTRSRRRSGCVCRGLEAMWVLWLELLVHDEGRVEGEYGLELELRL